MPFSDQFLEQWEHIIAEVSKTEVPLECIKKVIITLHGRKRKTLNLQTLRKQGLDLDQIESILSRTLSELDAQVRDVDFVVDVSEVAKLVQPETDRLLKDL